MSRGLLASVAVVALLGGVASAELCAKCKGKMYIQNIGTCKECGGHTSSGAFKLCGKCSAKLGQCEHCRAALKGAKPANVVALDEKANGKTVAVAMGKTLVVRLAGNITTGYGWTVKKLDGDALKQDGKVKYEQKKTPRPMVGSGGTFVATFNTVKPGKATIAMAYARPWEKDTPPIKTFTVTVTVEPAKAKGKPTK